MMIDRTLPLLNDGYLHLTRLRERAGRDTVPFRMLGRRATSLVGPEATKLFYDATSFDRQGVVPPNVQHTLFGDTAVHLLDGPAHHARKAFFTDVLGSEGTQRLVAAVAGSWDEAVAGWRGRQVVLFDEAARLLAAAVHEWAGVPLDEADVPSAAADMVAMVDGFATLGPRYVAARRARSRQERRLSVLASSSRGRALSGEPRTPFERALRHRDGDGELLDDHTVAVEMLNLLRPTVAVAWFVAYAAHALHHWPDERRLLLTGGEVDAVAFAHEVRRFYPFAPLLAARAREELYFDGLTIPADSFGVLDVFGQNHHEDLWPDAWTFSSQRHVEHAPGMYDLVPQGGGDPVSGHRCPGEPATVQILATLAGRIARLPATVPAQDLSVTRHRIPARVRSGMVLDVAPD